MTRLKKAILWTVSHMYLYLKGNHERPSQSLTATHRLHIRNVFLFLVLVPQHRYMSNEIRGFDQTHYFTNSWHVLYHVREPSSNLSGRGCNLFFSQVFTPLPFYFLMWNQILRRLLALPKSNKLFQKYNRAFITREKWENS